MLLLRDERGLEFSGFVGRVIVVFVSFCFFARNGMLRKKKPLIPCFCSIVVAIQICVQKAGGYWIGMRDHYTFCIRITFLYPKLLSELFMVKDSLS